MIPERDFRLVELFGYGLRRLGITPEQLTSTPPTAYARTIEWARAFHGALDDIDGLTWMSRQFNAAKALVLFGDRVTPEDLSPADPPIPLAVGEGRSLVDSAANRARILLIG